MNNLQSQKIPEMQPKDVISQARQIMDKYNEKNTKQFGKIFNNPYVKEWCNKHRQLPSNEVLLAPAAKPKKRVTFEDQIEPSAKKVKMLSVSQHLRV